MLLPTNTASCVSGPKPTIASCVSRFRLSPEAWEYVVLVSIAAVVAIGCLVGIQDALDICSVFIQVGVQ